MRILILLAALLFVPLSAQADLTAFIAYPSTTVSADTTTSAFYNKGTGAHISWNISAVGGAGNVRLCLQGYNAITTLWTNLDCWRNETATGTAWYVVSPTGTSTMGQDSMIGALPPVFRFNIDIVSGFTSVTSSIYVIPTER